MYEEIPQDLREEVRKKIFLPSKAYPKIRGRPPKYDYLFISIAGIDEDRARDIKAYLEKKTNRSVVMYSKIFFKNLDRETEKLYRYLIPWRDRESGKALPYKIGFLNELKNDIKSVARGINPLEMEKEEVKPLEKEKVKSITKDMEKTEVKEEVKHTPLMMKKVKEEEVKEEKIIKTAEAISDLIRLRKEKYERKYWKALKRKAEIEKEIRYLEEYGGIFSLRISKRKKLKKELEEVKSDIVKYRYLKEHPEMTEEDYSNDKLRALLIEN